MKLSESFIMRMWAGLVDCFREVRPEGYVEGFIRIFADDEQVKIILFEDGTGENEIYRWEVPKLLPETVVELKGISFFVGVSISKQ